MPHVQRWTAQAAVQLQAALRLSNEAFARKLGIAVRTVANWRAQPDLVPMSEMQQLLDTTLSAATADEKARFFAQHTALPQTHGPPPDTAAAPVQTLTVAVAIVADRSRVLIVHRRGDDGRGISWQFPAGMVKPGVRPDTAAVRETYAETGVHCAPIRSLGRRVHPITNVLCEYILCEYLSGEPHNRDEAENVSVTWALTDRLTRFIPVERIFPPVLDALGGTE